MGRFPQGRTYTIEVAADELEFLMTLLWDESRWPKEKKLEDGSVEDRVLLAVDKANSRKQQDNAMRYLLDSAEKRRDWMKDRLIKALRESRELQARIKELEGVPTVES